MIKPKLWKGINLTGMWQITYKVDGVRMLRDEEGNPVSRAGKPLYNLQDVPSHITDAEIYCKDWETSVSMVRTREGSPVLLECVYSLDPLDCRLNLGIERDPRVSDIEYWLEDAVSNGYEGLILRQEDKWLKVKPKETYDVEVLGLVEGTGKYKGKLGAIKTPMGKVGTGLTDKQREDFWCLGLPIGSTIEVDCMSLTKDNKFRHPRFVRIRWDK